MNRQYSYPTGTSYSRRGSQWGDSGKYAPSNNGSQGYPRKHKVKSTLAYNLGRIGKVLSNDMLASALGISEPLLQTLLRDNEPMVAEQYRPRLVEKLNEVSLPPAWLWTPNVTILPEHIEKLRKSASQSSNKEPIRRANFLKLVKEFEQRIETLATALEMTTESVLAVAEGRFPLDEQRFGHLNPILGRAGLPDGWLELETTEVSNEQITNLEEIAADICERDFAAYDLYLPEHKEQAQNSPLLNKTPTTMEHQTLATTETLVQSNPLPLAVKDSPQPEINSTFESESTTMESTFTSSPSATQTTLLQPGPNVASVVIPPAMPPQIPAVVANVAEGQEQSSAVVLDNAAAVAHQGNTAQHGKEGAKVRKVSSVPRGKRPDPETHEKRYAAMKSLIDASPVKKIRIFEDVLEGHANDWSNLKRIGADGKFVKPFTDTYARFIEERFELPEGWLDNPVQPPASIAAWLITADAPFPFARGNEQSKSAARSELQPVTAKVKVGPRTELAEEVSKEVSQPEHQDSVAVALVSVQPEDAPSLPAKRGRKKRVEQAAAPTTQESPVKAPLAQVAEETKAPEAVEQPSGSPVSPVKATARPVQKSSDTPAGAGTADQSITTVISNAGPVTKAAVATILSRIKDGAFSELDALKLLNQLMLENSNQAQ